jgi:DNA-binding NtrC family response regulator
LQQRIGFVLISGYATDETAFSMEEIGVQSLLTKPFTVTQLKFTLFRELMRLKEPGIRSLCDEPAAEGCLGGLKGSSAYIRDLHHKIRQISRGDIPVLIQGPTGTGKEIIARAIHGCSGRKDKPIIIVNSSAIPEHLEESEFFGHAKGAFTGAFEPKDGILRCAHGATLFLDEVGELSLRMQAKLLRVLDGHEFCRIGETVPQRSDFRLISATNRPLQDMVRDGSFRQDLFFRLKACMIQTESLATHREDIPCLVQHFLSRCQAKEQRPFSITAQAVELLVNYEWPGNVRELKNTIESLCTIAGKAGTITLESIEWLLNGVQRQSPSSVVPFAQAKIDFERNYYRSLLERFHGNISVAARVSGIERAYFSKRVKALGLEAGEFRAGGAFAPQDAEEN